MEINNDNRVLKNQIYQYNKELLSNTEYHRNLSSCILILNEIKSKNPGNIELIYELDELISNMITISSEFYFEKGIEITLNKHIKNDV